MPPAFHRLSFKPGHRFWPTHVGDAWFAVDAADPDIVYVATARRGVLRSADGGATWAEANAGLARLGRLWILDVTTDPAFPGVAYALPLKGGIFQARFKD